MNEQRSFERLFTDRMNAERGSAQLPDAFYDDFQLQARHVRQRPRWLAYIKEPPMRISSGVAVGSPTVRVAAIMVATLLIAIMIAGAGIAGSRLLAAEGTIVVDQSGNGTTTTITEAVAMAEDGDTILVRPGTYTEAIVIDNDITIIGDGPRDEIVIMAPEDGPTHDSRSARTSAAPYSVLLEGSDATISGLTLRGEAARVFADGGAPLIENLAFDGVGITFRGSAVVGGLVITGGATPTVRDNTFTEGGSINVLEDSEPLIEANTLVDGPAITGGFGPGAIIRGNEISGLATQGLSFLSPTTALIEANTITDRISGITTCCTASGPDFAPIIADNTISGSQTAISVPSGGRPEIRGNVLTENGWAIRPEIRGNVLTENGWAIRMSASDSAVANNDLRDNVTGISMAGGSPTLEGNTVTGGTTGIVIGAGTSARLSGNTVCDNEVNMRLVDGVDVAGIADNDICPDEAVEASE